MNPAALVLDASVTLAWAFRDEDSPYALGVLRALHQMRAWVPPIWPLEIANALLVAQRRQRLLPHEGPEFLAYLAQLPITVHDIPKRQTWRAVFPLAQEEGLSIYDASYLYLALRFNLPLATQDRRLQQAAQARGLWFQPPPNAIAPQPPDAT